MNTATTTYPTTTSPSRPAPASTRTLPSDFPPLASHSRLEVVIPVYNEAAGLQLSIIRLAAHLATLPYQSHIVIADNASTDGTWKLAQALAAQLPEVSAIRLEAKGRGRALKAAWLASDADILAYMDVDLSTDLSALEPLLAPLVSGDAPIATASRLQRSSQVVRGPKREIISRSYNWLVRHSLRTTFSDAQCGFKAIRRDAAQIILPTITDNDWFFDTELLAKAEHRGWNIHEVPAKWIDDPDSRVKLMATAVADIQGLVRTRRELALSATWEFPAFAVLLLATLALYCLSLSKSGNANSFYAAAVQAGTHSWKAFFFGSFDASNFITVDKPPFALWVMELSGRIFGFSSWSMLLPEALAGVATVAILTRTVRRWFGPVSGLISGAVLAATPVAALMFRFNNPDAILILLMTIAAWCTIRAVETGRSKWLVWVGALLGTAFITKMFQGVVLVPVFAGVYLLAGPPKLAKRLWQLAAAGVSLTVFALWWPIVVTFTPATSRPYIGGSTDNSIWNLIWGYNGLGRINGTAVGSPGTLGGHATNTASNAIATMGGGGAGGMGASGSLDFGGVSGIFRMFNNAFGTEISWLLPAALIIIAAGLYLRRGKPRTDLMRAGILLWGGWLMIHVLIFSFMKGTIHPYYAIALAPGLAALIGIGLPMMWQRFGATKLTWLWPVSLAVSTVWIWILLGDTPTFLPWLRWVIVTGGLLSAGIWWSLTSETSAKARHLLAGTGLAILMAGPLTFTIATASVAHAGSIPVAGPSSAAGMGGIGGQTGGGGMGGGLGTSAADTQLVAYLTAHKGSARWIAATVSTLSAAPVELASGGQPVMAIGGFNGSDDAPTLAQFEAYVKSGQLKYYFTSSSGDSMGPGGMGASSQTAILAWVKAHGTLVNYGGTSTLYDLSSAF